MPELSRHLVSLFHSGASRITKRAATEQGGLLSGKDPTEVNTADPIRLWIIQMGIIVTTASLLSLGLRKIRQPKVIAEVLGGILLGPTAFGRIPGFTEHIFPPDSIPFLSLTANIGLCLFLFLVGLEIEGAVIKRNAKMSVTVALAGMILPFGLGAGLSVPLYSTFIEPFTPDVKFTHFMLFAGVAFSITAFPVLCRILTELRLLDTTVGIVVLSAGVGNDIIGWTLLALSVALVNAGSGLTALYILLVCVGFALFILFPVKWVWREFARRSGSLEGKGPSMIFVTGTLIGVFGSSFFTDVIGVHAIFGAFLFGLIVPREGGLAISMTEKLEDMVGSVFLPLYFTLSGLNTDLGLLNTGRIWGYTIAICTLAFVGKFGGCTTAARYVAGFGWREASTIGALMSCKGLVELIVLNVGLQANILTRQVFSMFVLEALLLTFMTTPLVTTLYPPGKRVRVSATGANFDNVDGGAVPSHGHGHATDHEAAQPTGGKRVNFKKSLARFRKGKSSMDKGSEDSGSTSDEDGWGVDGEDSTRKRNFVVVLDRIEHIPGMMALTQLLRDSLVPSFASAPVSVAQEEKKDDEAINEKDALMSPGSASRASSSKDVTAELPSLPTGEGSTPSPPPSYHSPSATISALRLIELTDRTSAVMKSFPMHPNPFSAEFDPLLMIYRTYAGLNDLGVRGKVSVEPLEEMAGAVVDYANDSFVEVEPSSTGGMVLVPWAMPVQHHHSSQSHQHQHHSGITGLSIPPTPGAIPPPPLSGPSNSNTPAAHHSLHNPFDALFKSATNNSSSGGSGGSGGGAASLHGHFIRNVLARCREAIDVGLYLDLGSSSSSLVSPTSALGSQPGNNSSSITMILLPFFGGPDDRLALDFVAQMCENERVRAVVVRVTKKEGSLLEVEAPEAVHVDGEKEKDKVAMGVPLGEPVMTTVASNIHGFPDTIYGAHNTETRLQSETADNIAWARYASPTPGNNASNSASKAALGRMSFTEVGSPVPLHVVVTEAKKVLEPQNQTQNQGQQQQRQSKKLIVVTGRSRRLAVENHTQELKNIVEEYRAMEKSGLTGGRTAAHLGWEVRKTIGDVAAACVVAGCGEGVVVVQAAEDRDR
ncbi:K(+)/H(+) antiporter [Stygiomarasmius scandens]|uniref:K(+)/H(+) antiporter n=1 Tax=Marasmiellus scandens TaxID=2682957 RepID=A0ABR1JC96_9AGAR